MSELPPHPHSEPPWVVPERPSAVAGGRLVFRRPGGWPRGPGPIVRSMLLMAAFTAIVLSVGLVWWSVHSTRQSVVEQALPLQTQALEQMGRTLAFRVEQQQKPLQALASALTAHMGEPRAALQSMLQQQASMARLFERLQLADAQGQLLVNLQEGQMQALEALAEPERALLRRGLEDGKPLTKVWMHSDGTEVVLDLLHVLPLRSAQGKLVGVLGGSLQIPAQTFLPAGASTDLDEKASLLLLGPDGKVLAKNEHGHWQLAGSSDLAWVRDVVDADWVKSVQLGALGEQRGQQLWSAVPLPWTQWVLLKVSNVQAWAPGLTRHEQWTILAIAVAAALALALVLALIAYPLTELYRRSQRALQNQLVDEVDSTVRGALWWRRLSEHDWGEAQALRSALQALGQSREAQHEKQLEMQLQLQTLMDYAPVGLVVTQASRIQRVGMQAARILGYTPRELQDMPVQRLCSSSHVYEQLVQRIQRDLDIYGQFDSETSLQRKDGSTVWVRIHGQSMQRMRRSWEAPKREAQEDFLVWEVEDVTTQRLVREQSGWKAMHDPLTKLPNRAAFAMRLQEWLRECAEATVEEGTDGGEQAEETAHGVILYLDLDHFSQINQQGGRQAGDEVLGHIARLIEASVRPQGWVARVGGDEFAVLLPGATQQQGMRTAQLLCMAVQDWEGAWEGRRYLMGVSIGLLVIDARRYTVAAALKAADMACYAAKRKGRNRVEVMTRVA